MKFKLLIMAYPLFSAVCAQDILTPMARPDSHAPISIMGDHTHGEGELMLSYRYMFMDMDGMRNGSSRIASAGVFDGNYTVAPTSMTMQMHMFGAMFAPSDRFTLSVMLPYISNEMSHTIFPGAAPLIALNNGRSGFTTQSDGLGDLRLGSLIRIVHDGPHHFHGGFGVSLPTGSIGEADVMPGPGGLLERQLPAAMQLGSGTFDLLPSLTYAYMADAWSAGAQVSGAVHTGRNAHGYTLGDRVDLTSWYSRKVFDWVSLSTGLSYQWEDELAGAQSDVSLNPPFAPTRLTVPTAFGGNYGGQKLEVLLGANLVIPGEVMRNHRVAADLRVPLWQDRNGLGLGADYTLALGWQYAF